MRSRSSTAFATRLSGEETALVEDGIKKTEQTPTELLRGALEYYIQGNPDRIDAFYPGELNEKFCSEFM